AIISVVMIAVRAAWVFPRAYLPRLLDAWRNRAPNYPPWRAVLFVGWAGVRGADSLVIALALPMTTAAGTPFPGRGAIIVVTFTVILVALVVQGLTLTPALKLLGLLRTDDGEEREENEARLRTARAGVGRLDRLIAEQPALADVARALRERHRHRVHRYFG